MSKKLIMILAAGTLIGFGGAGILIIYFFIDIPVKVVLAGREPLFWQIIAGLIFGFISAKAAWAIVEQPFLSDVKRLFSNIFRPMNLNKPEVIFISLCAGMGEEIFFRGAVQPFLGVWITAILFVFLHGYINPFQLPLTIYGLYMTVVIGVMGLMTIHFGIVSSIVAHFVIDLILLINLTASNHEEVIEPDDTASP
jgi:membrane protease YdiL (CAAX protease family)